MSEPPKHQAQKPQIKYEKVHVIQAPISSAEERSDVEPEDLDNIDTNDNNNAHDNTTKHLWEWMLHNPTSKLPFFYFVICIVLAFILAILYIMDNDTAFIISGLLGITTALYGLNHFRGLLYLRKQVDRFHTLNKTFRSENKELNTQVSRLSLARNQLAEVHQQLQNINIKTRENNMKFRQIQEHLKVTNLDSIKGIEAIRSKASNIGDSWKESVLQRERQIICRIFERVEYKDDCDGISREEFDELAEMLPDGYKERFERLGTFNHLAANKSVIDVDDFRMALDVFAEMNVDDCDIQFKIDKVPNDLQKNKSDSVDDDEDMPQFLKRLCITKRSKPGATLSLEDIESFR